MNRKHIKRLKRYTARVVVFATVGSVVIASRPLTGCDWLLPALLFGPVVVADLLKWTLDRI